jgi:D-alanyl-D-alanine carboxypeptidase
MLRTYEGIVGGKTGYDDDAGWCLVNVAERDGSRMIAVTMNGVAPDDWYDDNRVLLNYGFDQKAQRAQSGTGVTGEVVRYRDPDAAAILALASASGAIGGATEPVQTTSEPASVAEQSPLVAENPAPDVPVLIPAAPPSLGVSGGAVAVAAGVAAALIVLQGLSVWRLRSPSPARSPLADFGTESAASASD